jgi:hypothetical protein
MSRPREITLKNVAHAAEKLLREDRKPTRTLVQHITGGGFDTVKDLFGLWQASRPAVGELERVAPELLRSLCEALRRSAALGRAEETQGREVAEENYKTLAGEMKELVLERDQALDLVQTRTGERDLQIVTAVVHLKEIALMRLQLDELRTLRSRAEADLYMAVQREIAHADQVLAQDARLASAAKELEQLGIRLRQE